MSENIDVKAILTAEDEASPVIRSLLRQVRRLEKANFGISTDKLKAVLTGAAVAAARIADAQRAQAQAIRSTIAMEGRRQRAETVAGADLRKRLSFEARMQRQRQGEERRAARTAASVLRSEVAAKMRIARQDVAAKVRADALQFRALRQKLAFGARMERQRTSEAREIERQDRLRETAHRREVGRIDRENRARRRAFANTGRTSTGALRDASNGIGTAAMLTGGAAAAGGYAITRRETEADSAEINARIYGGLSATQARQTRQWARVTGADIGMREADLLNVYVDALKLGIDDAAAKKVAVLNTQLAEGFGISSSEVSAVTGKIIAVQISNGDKFDFSKVYGVGNAVQHLAAETAVSPSELLSFQGLATGAAKALGMDPKFALALGATGIQQGLQPYSMANMLSFTAARIPQLAEFERQDGIEGQRTRRMLRDLGYGNTANMNRQKSKNPDGFVFDLFERISKIKDPAKRNASIQAYFGTEWFNEASAVANSMPAYRKATALVQESSRVDAIDKMWSLHLTKLSTIGKQIDAAFGGLLGSLGEIVGPTLKDVGRRLTAWIEGNAKAVQIGFYAGMQGLAAGLLGRDGTMKDLVTGLFGDIGSNPAAIYEFAKGVGDGLRDVWSALVWIGDAAKSFMQVVGANSAQEMGRLAAQTLGLGMAAKVASPWVSIVKDAAIAIGAGIFSIVKVAGLLGGSAAVAGAGAALGAAAIPVAITAAAITLAVTIANWDSLREIWKGWFGEPGWTTRRRENEEARKNGKHPDFIDRWLTDMFGGAFGRRSDAVTGGSGQVSTRGYAARDRIVGSDLGAALQPMGGRSGGKPMLDAIARAEGTAGRGDYNASLGYGRFLPGGREQDLTSKSLAEVYQLGLHMRRQPGNPNSSALGRYQITGSTMRDAASALGMDMATTKFDAATQDRMAEWIRQRQGFGAWEGFKRNPAELATARAAVAGAPTISGSAVGGAVDGSVVRYANQNATRNKKITDSLHNSLAEAVTSVYGAGYTAEVYSGGQDHKGQGGRRTGSTRHDGGQAADVYIRGPDGKKLSGDALGPIAQWWLANKKGGVGMEMRGGGIHLDEHTNRAKNWDYGPLTPGQRQAVAAGLAGQVPPSAARTAPADLAARVPIPSARPGGAGGGGMGGGGGVSIGGITVNGTNRDPREIAQEVGREFQRIAGWTTGDLAFDS